MAILTNQDFTRIKNWIHTQPLIKAEFRTWTLTKAQFTGALQAVETWQVGGFNSTPTASLKAAIEMVTGATTVLRARYLVEAWVSWKIRSIQGG